MASAARRPEGFVRSNPRSDAPSALSPVLGNFGWITRLGECSPPKTPRKTCVRMATIHAMARVRYGVFAASLKGKIAVVAGASRGCGRGIAVALGEQAATVYVTGRTVRGGVGIHVRVDYTDAGEVKVFFDRVRTETCLRYWSQPVYLPFSQQTFATRRTNVYRPFGWPWPSIGFPAPSRPSPARSQRKANGSAPVATGYYRT